MTAVPFFISVPHSGEDIPPEAPWLNGLAEPILMCDVDRYVDRLYRPAADTLKIPFIVTQWHRYVVDPNRLPEDIDRDSVAGSQNPSGTFPIGLHWSVTTQGHVLIAQPMSQKNHKLLVEKYYQPFHQKIQAAYDQFKKQGHHDVYHLDAHSMPSMGTEKHRDPGQRRPEIVVSDSDGKSCSAIFKDLVIASYEQAGFEVAYNWPYKGGRVTETYGKPAEGQHAIQVELNRDIYMDEITKQLKPLAEPREQSRGALSGQSEALSVADRIKTSITHIYKELSSML